MLVDPFVGDLDPLGHRLIRDVGDHGGQGALAAQHLDGLHPPHVALFTQRARFVLGLAGFQGGPLRQREHLDDGGFTAMVDLELLGQLTDTMVNGRASRGEFLDQSCSHADDFAHRAFAAFGGGFGETHTELCDEQRFDAGVVKL